MKNLRFFLKYSKEIGLFKARVELFHSNGLLNESQELAAELEQNGDVVLGWTWVKDFVKGPEHLPVVVKTRVLDNTNRV